MAQAGWYPDPAGNAQLLRYWNGTAWTEQVTSAQGSQPAQQPAQVQVQQPAQVQAQQPMQAQVQQPASQQSYVAQVYDNGSQPTVVVVNQPPAPPKSSKGVFVAAFVLCVISTVFSFGYFVELLAISLTATATSAAISSSFSPLVRLAWQIPMTVHCYKIYKGEKPNTTAFGVCTLLFLSPIGGILLLTQPKSKAQ